MPAASIDLDKMRLGNMPLRADAEHGNGEQRQAQTQKPPEQRDGQSFRQHQEEHGTVLEPDGLENGEFAGALAHGNGHGVARDQKQGEENHAADGQDEELDVAELLHPARGEGGFGLGLRFVGGVGELRVNGLGHADGVIRRVELAPCTSPPAP